MPVNGSADQPERPPASPIASRPGPLELRLDRYQQRIVDALVKRGATEPAQLYMGALWILSRPDFPGAAYFLGHACREIWSALPRWVDAPIEARMDYTKLLDDMLPDWKKTAIPQWSETDSVVIPVALYKRLDGLFRQHERSRQDKRRENARAMFRTLEQGDTRGYGSFSERDIDAWLGVGDEVHGLAHLRTKGHSPPHLAEAQKVLADLERILWSQFVQPEFYEGVEELDEILRDANA